MVSILLLSVYVFRVDKHTCTVALRCTYTYSILHLICGSFRSSTTRSRLFAVLASAVGFTVGFCSWLTVGFTVGFCRHLQLVSSWLLQLAFYSWLLQLTFATIIIL